MDAIIGFFEGIGNAITGVIKFVVSMFQDIVYVITLTAKVAAEIPSYFSWLPAELVAIVGIIVALVVLYKILGREG